MEKQQNKKVFAAMSGGVDSSVAAALLKERGFDVVGVHIKMWSDPSIPCNFKEDRYDAMRVADMLKISFQTWDFTDEYRREVVNYMIREYAAGRTPNPDVMCNRHIKFGVFLERSLSLGADFIATGHYVRIEFRGEGLGFSEKENSDYTLNPIPYTLLAAKDQNKDQSYFLWTLTQDQLKHCLFPIGEFTKPEVREMARARGLPTAEKPDSQGICFIGEIDLRAFLQQHIPISRGPVITTSGRAIGEHEGLSFYTIGQREGLGIGGGIPYYVAAKDFTENILVVAEGPYDEKLFARDVAITDVNWISGATPKLPLQCEARIRYRQPLEKCVIKTKDESMPRTEAKLLVRGLKTKDGSLKVTFSEAQRAVTPGQSIVFYSGDKMLGGGVITGIEA